MTEAKIPPRPTGPHPTAEQLYQALAAERSSACTAADEEVFAHAALCADCSAEIAHLEAFDQPEAVAPGALDAAWQLFRHRANPEAGRAPAAARPRLAPVAPLTPLAPKATIVPFPAPRRPAPSVRHWHQAGWAAAAMLAVGLGLGFFLGTSTVLTPGAPAATPAPPQEETVQPVPDGPRGGSIPATSPDEIAPTGPLDQVPTEIRFANPRHEPKRILLFATDLPYWWQSPETTAEVIEIPAAERAKLKPGVDYFWSVLDAEGETAAQTFRLRRR